MGTVPALAVAQVRYTYADLVSRLTDLEALAVLPAPGERTALASSYDRESRYDPVHDAYLAWGANNDCCGIVRREGGSQVLAEIEGPGIIWRIWSASPGGGHVRIFLDDAAEPAIDLPFADYFGTPYSPFHFENLSYHSVLGQNNYTPIPFQKSCRILADDGWGQYYQFTYSTYPPGTSLPTFQIPFGKSESAALARADKVLAHAGDNPAGPRPGERQANRELRVGPGQTADVADLHGARAIVALKVKLDLPRDAEAERRLLRLLALRITWDDDEIPAVWSPLSDFFGYVGGAMPYASLPLGALPDGTFYSYWYMPFAQRAHIEVENNGNAPVAMTWQIRHAPLDRPIAELARFHAKWHRDAFEPARPDRWPDWTLLTTFGRGRYVGTHLHVWNPRGDWWGEGDDKFFVDDEKFPSIFGTGTEDYFGYAWSNPSLFSRPYHNQILNEDNRGHVDANRWHISDSIPFQTGLGAFLEKYFPNDRATLYAAVAYWYLAPGGSDPYPPFSARDRIYWTPDQQ
jgi:hypothetical protein